MAEKDQNSTSLTTVALRPAGSILAFLGFPMRVRRAQPYGKPTPSGSREFFLNLISWPDLSWREIEPFHKAMNCMLAPLMVLWHLAILPFKLLGNVAKFIAAACPLLLSNIALNAAGIADARSRQIKSKKEKNAMVYSSLYRLAFGVLSGLGYLAYAVYFIGRAVVSPVQGIRQAFHQETINPKMRGAKKKFPLPLAARVFLAGLSGVITITAYALLIPMALPLIIAKIPMLAQIATVLAQTKIGVWVSNALASVGNFVSPMVGTVLQAVGIAAAPSVIVGGASLFGVGAATVAPVVGKTLDEISNSYDAFNLNNTRSAKIHRVVGAPSVSSPSRSAPEEKSQERKKNDRGQEAQHLPSSEKSDRRSGMRYSGSRSSENRI